MMYWLIAILIAILIYFKRKEPDFYLKAAIYIFAIGAILRLVGLNFISEFLMRLDFMFWIAGISLAIRENRDENKI